MAIGMRWRRLAPLMVLAVASALATAAVHAQASAVRGAKAADAGATARPADLALVSGVTASLARAGTIRARFTQTQTLASMKQPLVSTGSLLVDRALGIVWRIDTPYRATYVITDAGVREIDAGGRPVSQGGARGLAQVSRMMRGMLSGDLSALYSQFDVAASGTPARWRMSLKPNQPQLRQVLGELQLGGGEFLRTLNLVYANGNQTTLEFSGTARIDAPSAVERAWLETR